MGLDSTAMQVLGGCRGAASVPLHVPPLGKGYARAPGLLLLVAQLFFSSALL